MSLRKRLEIVLAELAERFGVPDSRGTLLMPELAQEELAEMIGSSRPMVSKLLTEMTERGMLIREGRRHILMAAPKPVNVTGPDDCGCIPRRAPRTRPRGTRTTRGNPAPRRTDLVPAQCVWPGAPSAHIASVVALSGAPTTCALAIARVHGTIHRTCLSAAFSRSKTAKW